MSGGQRKKQLYPSMARAWQEYTGMPFPRERRAERHIKSSQAKVQW